MVDRRPYISHYPNDFNKNVTKLSNSKGQLTTTYDYSPYGEVTTGGSTPTPHNPLQWSSEIHDPALSLTYYNYRHYNPADGRWISRDPIEEEGGVNLYGFVGNAVSMLVDMWGLALFGQQQQQPPPPEMIDPKIEEGQNRSNDYSLLKTIRQPYNGCQSKGKCLVSMTLEFEGALSLPQLQEDIRNRPEYEKNTTISGKAYYGTMTLYFKDGSTCQMQVFSGGVLFASSKIKQGSNTLIPEGKFRMSTTLTSGSVEGFPISGTPNRSGIKLHSNTVSPLTHGCVAIPKTEWYNEAYIPRQEWDDLEKIMANQKSSCKKRSIPLKVTYDKIRNTENNPIQKFKR